MVAKIERVDLRAIFKHEALDFTKWLEQNIDVLNDVLDLQLSSANREQSTGNFSVDLTAEDEQSGSIVAIENQLEKSNHDHLGKIITYLSSIGAKIGIWIVSEARPEHVKAVAWLNESKLADIYLVKVEGIKVGSSEPAPLFTKIVGPSEESRLTGDFKEEVSERNVIRYEFWKSLLEMAKNKTRLHAGITPSQHGWITTGAGKSGLGLAYVIGQEYWRAELYIDRGKGSDEENKHIFDTLLNDKAKIEVSFGGKLEWERLDNKRASRIKIEGTEGGYRSPKEKWVEIQNIMINNMVNLEKALKPFVDKLDI